ncbi:MAG: hypothetical protein ABIJ34_03895 [archaeon]
MIPVEQRQRPFHSDELAYHLQGERGKKYFPHCETSKERYKECVKAIIDPLVGVIVPDEREVLDEEQHSTHQCLFINSSGENIALPIALMADGKIAIITITNIAEHNSDPKWFYDNYNRIAVQRGMKLMERMRRF